MHWLYRLSLALAILGALLSSCLAQEVALVDLTAVEARVDLRRPKSTAGTTGGRGVARSITHCSDSAHKAGALETSLVSLDRAYYQARDEPRFEVTLQNTGSEPIRVPVSPHLADLQPKDPAKEFSYNELQVALWISSSGDRWSTNQGGTANLYGNDDHAGTMLTLQSGEWVRVLANGNIRIDDQIVELIKSGFPADHAYAEASLFREETMLTSTYSATVAHESCVAQTYRQTAPIRLSIP
jgi:hypothetical protein